MCVFCNVWLCVNVGFVICGCVSVDFVVMGFCSVWVCVSVVVVMCGCVCV